MQIKPAILMEKDGLRNTFVIVLGIFSHKVDRASLMRKLEINPHNCQICWGIQEG